MVETNDEIKIVFTKFEIADWTWHIIIIFINFESQNMIN